MKIRNIVGYALSLWCMTLVTSCTKDEVDITGNIVGIVTDARTNEPLSGVGVTVTPTGKTAVTASDGRYEIKDIDAQDYSVQAKKANYVTETKTVTVRVGEDTPLNFLLTPSTPQMEITQAELDFGTQSTTLSLDISNTGYAVLKWEISENVSWLSCTPSSGSIQPGERSAVVIHVNREGMDRGNYSQTFSIASNGGSKVIRVSMSVEGITLSVSPESLDFGPTGTVLPLTIHNTSSRTASYTLSTSNTWIKLAKKSGTLSPSSDEQINVSVDRAEMSEGDYGGEIILSANDLQLGIPVRMNIPAKEKPIVYLSGVTDVTYADAIFSGAIVSVGSSNVSRHGFCWSTAENPTVEDAELCNFGDCTAAKEFTHKALALEQATTYYVRAFAENREGISYSNQEKFVTSGIPSVPTVETGVVSNIQSAQAEVSGVLTHMGNLESVTQYGHVWSTKGNPTINDHKTTFGTTWSTGSFTSTLTDLKPNVTYHVRAYATNEKGTAYGEDVTFTTDYAAVVLTTTEATNILSKSAKVGGKITDTGGHKIVERGVCWAQTSEPSLNDLSAVATSGEGEFVAALSGLIPETPYYARAYVKTKRGDVYYGNVVSFTTPTKEVGIIIDDCDDEQFWEK